MHAYTMEVLKMSARLDNLLASANSVKYCITVCTHDNNGNKFAESTIASVIAQFAQFGGYTIGGIQSGYWLDNGTTYKDESFTISTITDRSDSNLAKILAIAESVKLLLSQESVLLEIYASVYTALFI